MFFTIYQFNMAAAKEKLAAVTQPEPCKTGSVLEIIEGVTITELPKYSSSAAKAIPDQGETTEQMDTALEVNAPMDTSAPTDTSVQADISAEVDTSERAKTSEYERASTAENVGPGDMRVAADIVDESTNVVNEKNLFTEHAEVKGISEETDTSNNVCDNK